jgi:branched-chain amino acid transport system permease protein
MPERKAGVKRIVQILLAAGVLALPLVIRNKYDLELLVISMIFAIFALSLNLILGFMKQFTFGHQAFLGIGAYTSAILAQKGGVPVWLSILAAIVMSGLVGYLVGYIALRSTRGMALAIVTLGFGVIVLLFVSRAYGLTNGMSGLHGIPPLSIRLPFGTAFELKSERQFFYVALAALVLTMYFLQRLLRSRFGRSIISLGENEDLAASVGVSPFHTYLMTFVISTALAGFSGALYAHYLRFIQPSVLTLNYMVMAMIMVLVGGSGTLGGPVVGAWLFTYVPDHLPMNDQTKKVIFGIILFLVILFMKKGIFPYLLSFWERLFAGRKARVSAGKL